MKKIIVKNDHVLVALVLVLWAYGRIFNSLMDIGFVSTGDPPTIFTVAAVLYVILHAFVFFFALWLLVSSSPWLVKRSQLNHASLWQITLYCYVLVTIAISILFFVYEFWA
jgi:hypothetical protein